MKPMASRHPAVTNRYEPLRFLHRQVTLCRRVRKASRCRCCRRSRLQPHRQPVDLGRFTTPDMAVVIGRIAPGADAACSRVSRDRKRTSIYGRSPSAERTPVHRCRRRDPAARSLCAWRWLGGPTTVFVGGFSAASELFEPFQRQISYSRYSHATSLAASHREASHRAASHRAASHRAASHRAASHPQLHTR
jgi:hypothetical protein